MFEMSYYEICAELTKLNDTIRMLFNSTYPDDFAEVAKQKQYTVHRFCGLKVVKICYPHDDPEYGFAEVTLNGIDINASLVSKKEFLKYKNPILEIMKLYKCKCYIKFDLGKPSRALFDIDGTIFAANELTSKFTREMLHPIYVDDIDSLFYPNNQENMAEFLVDCLRLDPIIGSYMPYKEKY